MGGESEGSYMRLIQGIGIFNILIGFLAFLAPVKFYLTASSLFTPSVSPPFTMGAVKTTTLFLFLPGIVLVINGIALIALGMKLQRVPEIKAFTEAGDYLGEVKGVEVEEGRVEKIEVGEEPEPEVYPKEKVAAVDDVMLVKEEKAPPMTKHEIVGKEVYSEAGDYYGKVESVTLNEEGKLLEFLVVKGETKRILSSADILTRGTVILVKAR
jgi:sporulation protein YlmC with PRC-barrel domain